MNIFIDDFEFLGVKNAGVETFKLIICLKIVIYMKQTKIQVESNSLKQQINIKNNNKTFLTTCSAFRKLFGGF